MQLQLVLPAAFFAASALAAKFNAFSDIACQQYDGTYIPVTGAQLQDIVLQEWPTVKTTPGASRGLITAADRKNCPPNEDDTYKWVSPSFSSRPLRLFRNLAYCFLRNMGECELVLTALLLRFRSPFRSGNRGVNGP
jgi:hypothetical protein